MLDFYSPVCSWRFLNGGWGSYCGLRKHHSNYANTCTRNIVASAAACNRVMAGQQASDQLSSEQLFLPHHIKIMKVALVSLVKIGHVIAYTLDL